MSLGTKQSKRYLNIKEGKIVYRTPKGEELKYDFIEGHLLGIAKRERDFKGENVLYWYIDLQVENGDIYSLSLPYSSGVVKAILNSLASVEGNLGRVKIETYQSGEFTKTIVYNNGERLSWKYTELPPVEEVKVGDKIIKNDSKRMELFNQIAQDIVNRVNTII